MDLTTFLRLVHIFSAIFWVGTTLFMLFFFEPVVRDAGQAGQQILQMLAATRFPQAIALSGFLTVFAGLALYWRMYGFHIGTMFGPKLALTLGALAGFAAVIVGTSFQGRAVKALTALGEEVAAQKHPPTPEQMALMQAHRARIELGTRIAAALMAIAVVGMAM